LEVFEDPDTGEESIGGTEVTRAISAIDPEKPQKDVEEIVRQAAGVEPGEEILGHDYLANTFLKRLRKVFLRRSTSRRRLNEERDSRMPLVQKGTPVI